MPLLNTEVCRQSLLQLQSCLHPKSNLYSDLSEPPNFSSTQREFQIPPNQIISILCLATEACSGREVFSLSLMSIRRAVFLMSQKCWQQTHSIKMIEKQPDTLILWKNKATGHIISCGREIISWEEHHLFAADAAADLDPFLPKAGVGQANWDLPGHCISWASPHWPEGRVTSKDCMSPVKQQISFSPLCCKETSDGLTQSTVPCHLGNLLLRAVSPFSSSPNWHWKADRF